ncbi:MAG: hypothetical protein K6G62_01915 [Eubacterium sp.]|nr:hypothetical protein [Eubacterium sp.]
MKFNSKDELKEISFEESEILDFYMDNEKVEFRFNGATIRPGNSQNARFQDVYCGEIQLDLEGAKLARLVKEGMKYFDPDGKLLEEIPDQDIEGSDREEVFSRLKGGKVFTTVEAPVKEGYGIEWGIDLPRTEEPEEIDTYWLCFTYQSSRASWDRYCGPAES